MTNGVFNPNLVQTDSETKTFADIIFSAFRTKQLELHTSFPAEITQINADGSVSIQPSLKRKFIDGKVIDLPVLQDVPVLFPRGSGFSVRFPIAVGDSGLAVASERSLDVWKISGGSVDPNDGRLHDISDVVFYPGLYPLTDPLIAGKTTDMELIVGKAVMSIQPTGTFKMQGASAEFLKTMNDILTEITNLVTAIQSMSFMYAPGTSALVTTGPATNLSSFTPIATNLGTLTGKLTSLVGS